MMADNPKNGFTSLENIVSDIQLQIGDLERKQNYTMILQRVLNVVRDLFVNISPYYKQEPVDINNNLRSGKYPSDLVKIMSVGVYVQGKYFPFTREPSMANTVTGDGETFDEDFGEGKEIPRRGWKFGARGYNRQGYWIEDDVNRRFFIRNYEEDKVIVHYKSNGIDCSKKTCIPYQMKDVIMAMVIYDLALKRIPMRHSAAELQLLREERARHFEAYTALEYEPQDMNEMMDAVYQSLNNTVRRGL